MFFTCFRGARIRPERPGNKKNVKSLKLISVNAIFGIDFKDEGWGMAVEWSVKKSLTRLTGSCNSRQVIIQASPHQALSKMISPPSFIIVSGDMEIFCVFFGIFRNIRRTLYMKSCSETTHNTYQKILI